jgi:hypothetical protein
MPASDFKPAPELKRLAVLLDIAIVSDQAGEAENALRAVIQHLRKTKLRASDFVEATVERDRALDALAKYEAKLTALETEIKRLHNGGGSVGTLAQALWQDAGMPCTVESRHTRWALDLEAQGLIHLTTRETDFLGSCSRRSRLSQAQQSPQRHRSHRASPSTVNASAQRIR